MPVHLALAAALLLAASVPPPASPSAASPSAVSAAAPPPSRPLDAETLWRLPRLGPPALTPDGRQAVLAVTRYDLAADKGQGELWLVPTAGGEPRPLTAAGSASGPAVSPDGQAVAFLSRRGDDEAPQVYLLPLSGAGEARRLTQVPGGAEAIRWFPDSRRLAFAARVYPEWKGFADVAERLKAQKESKVTARVFDRAPARAWDTWLDGRVPHLFSVAVEGGEPQPITAGGPVSLPVSGPVGPGSSASQYDISPDGKEVVFQGDADRTGLEPNQELWLVPVAGGAPRNLTADNPAADTGPRWSPDGRTVAFLRQVRPRHWGERARAALLDRTSGKVRVLTEAWDRSVEGLTWARDGKALYTSADDEGHHRLFRIDAASGGVKRLTERLAFSDLALSADGRTAVALRQGHAEPPTLVRVDLSSGEAKKLTAFEEPALAGVALGRYESVTFAGGKGEPVQMWVVYPPGFDPSRRYPALLLLHGGPHVAIPDAFHWRWNAQVFAGWGYVVAWHAFHGTPGFGQAFTDSIVPDNVTLPYEDTVAAARWLAGRPYVDPSRLAAAGGSFGGYLAAVLLGREHPFRTLVSHAGVHDRVGQYASDYGASRKEIPEFWQDEPLYRRLSPIQEAARFRTPTLVIHGGRDYRVPDAQGLELWNVLQNRGVRSRLVHYPDENHWILRPQNSVFWYRQVQEWLEEQLRAAPAAG